MSKLQSRLWLGSDDPVRWKLTFLGEAKIMIKSRVVRRALMLVGTMPLILLCEAPSVSAAPFNHSVAAEVPASGSSPNLYGNGPLRYN
jgi:hypothetical protein